MDSAADAGQRAAAWFSVLTQRETGIAGTSLSPNEASSFIDALTAFTEQLMANEHVSHAEWVWRKSIALTNGDCGAVLLQLARFIIRTEGNLLEAFDLARKCVLLGDNSAFAYDLLENIKGLIVDRWHFRMLNDDIRNSAYKNAIEAALKIRPGSTVLDIGGGTGILSIYAAMAGAKRVYCCEASEALAQIATQCVRDSGYGMQITVIAKHSNDLTIGELGDIDEHVDVVVTELVDSGLLGEHIIPVLRDAQTRLMKPDGITIPYKATVYCMPIECADIASRQTLLNSSQSTHAQPIKRNGHESVEPDSQPVGFAHVVKEALLESHKRAGISLVLDESYTCEQLSANMPYTALSKPTRICDICFNDGSDKTARSNTFSADLTITNNGYLHAMAYWFELELADDTLKASSAGCGNTCFSTAYHRKRNAWDQALYYMVNHSEGGPGGGDSLEDHFLYMENGSRKTIVCTHDDDRLHFQISTSQHGTSHGTPAGRSHLGNHVGPFGSQSACHAFVIGEMDMARLNDNTKREACINSMVCGLQNYSDDFMKHKKNLAVREFRESTASVTEHNQNDKVEVRGARVLELTADWQAYALEWILSRSRHDCGIPDELRRLSQGISSVRVASLSEESTDYFRALVEPFAGAYESRQDSTVINTPTDSSPNPDVADSHPRHQDSCSSMPSVYFSTNIVEEYGLHAAMKANLSLGDVAEDPWGPYDIIICDLIDASGMIRQRALEDLRFALTFLSHTHDDNADVGQHVNHDMSAEARDDTTKYGRCDGVQEGRTTVIPHEVSAVAALLECEALLNNHRVREDRTCGAKVQGLNGLGADMLRDLDLDCLEGAQLLSKPTVVHTLKLKDVCNERIDLQATSTALKSLRKGTVHAVAVWYELILDESPDELASAEEPKPSGESTAGSNRTPMAAAGPQPIHGAGCGHTTRDTRYTAGLRRMCPAYPIDRPHCALSTGPEQLTSIPPFHEHERCSMNDSTDGSMTGHLDGDGDPNSCACARAGMEHMTTPERRSSQPRKHFRQTAFLLGNPKPICVDEVVKVIVEIDLSAGLYCSVVDTRSYST